MRGICWVAEDLLASQERLWSMELVSYERKYLFDLEFFTIGASLSLQIEPHHCKATHTGQSVVHVKYMRNRNMFQRTVAVLKQSRTKNQLSNLQFWFLYYPDTSRNYMHQSTVRYLRMYALCIPNLIEINETVSGTEICRQNGNDTSKLWSFCEKRTKQRTEWPCKIFMIKFIYGLNIQLSFACVFKFHPGLQVTWQPLLAKSKSI